MTAPRRDSAGQTAVLAGGRGQDGFTLIETVAIMAITGLLLAVVLPALPHGVSRPQMEGLAVAVAAVLTGDHEAALRRHQTVSSLMDGPGRTVRSGAGGRTIALPEGIAITSVLPETCVGERVKNSVVFLPNGTSCGGRMTLARSGQAIDIRVNWLTGAAEIVSREQK